MAEQLLGPFEKFVVSPYYSVYVSEKWVERCKNCIACQGRYFEKETVTAPPQSSDSEWTGYVWFRIENSGGLLWKR
jgi:hypothetical protein